ncbi:MAG TPA: ABC transporter ATP-binding protein [Candidatus Dormibacteraeota bacterium]|nr:ABC transporter ATP-binding protein [Candidatus Dormibacteraeota bacterium]
MSLLEIESVSKRFGSLLAVNEVSFKVEMGDILGIIGPNGAGKSTLFNMLSGIYRPDSGQIVFAGRSIVGLPPERIAPLGISRTFQNLRLFTNASALQNVLVGEHARLHSNIFDALVNSPRERRESKEAYERAYELLRYVGIEGVGESFARNLSYGTQRRLEIARALAASPSLLLLDEPAAGLNPSEKVELVVLVRAIRSAGTTVVLIEHDMGLVMQLCERIVVFDRGERIADGPPDEIRADARVIEAYLGTPQ